jgi:hypothetical protein
MGFFVGGFDALPPPPYQRTLRFKSVVFSKQFEKNLSYANRNVTFLAQIEMSP